MATASRSRSAAEPRSGGKIVRPRRAAAARTPYDRPSAPNPAAPENPSWLARFVLPPTRFIASGAGKILSSVFTPDSDSDSDSSSGADSSSEDEFDDDGNSERADNLNKKDGTSEMAERFQEAEPGEKSETKRAIEELIMQETFSREESNKLIRIIKSRVVDSTVTEDVDYRRRDGDMPDLCSTALLEAKKWLEEKRLESSSKPKYDLTFNTAVLSPVTVDNESSPVDVAKSYMQVRPPWASPSSNPTEFKSPSSRGVQLFREETPYTIGGNSMSSSKLKKDYYATGSWNIQEEIRRVRSKATEEMLRTPPSAKINWSALAVENKSSLNSSVADKIGLMEDKREKSSSSIEGTLNLATGMTASPQFFPVLETANDSSQNGALLANPADCVPMDLEATQVVERNEGLNDGSEDLLASGQKLLSTDVETLLHGDAGAGDIDSLKGIAGTDQKMTTTIEETIQGSRLQDENCSTSKVIGTGGLGTENGVPSSGSNLPAAKDMEKTSRPFDEEEHNVDDSNVQPEKTRELLSETTVEVPTANENDGMTNGSQPDSTNARDDDVTEKYRGKRPTRNRKGGWGRGK